MKKFLGLLVMFMMISSNCLAMTFSQPVEIGNVATGAFGPSFSINKASSNEGERYSDTTRKNLYVKGIAKFGNGDDSIYFHYNGKEKYPNNSRFGSKNINNTFPCGFYVCILYKITSDENITLYAINDIEPTSNYMIVGRKTDGTFVKYLDTNQITKQYLGSSRDLYFNVSYFNLIPEKDTLKVSYKLFSNNKVVQQGEFRFKWDDKAQWFGVEQVVY